MKNTSIFGLEFFFLILIPFRKTKKSICSSIGFFLTLINLKIVPRELLGPSNLIKAQILCIHQLTRVIMICKYQNFMLTVLQIVALSLKGFNNSQKLTVVGLIPSFVWNYFSQKVYYRMLLTQIT